MKYLVAIGLLISLSGCASNEGVPVPLFGSGSSSSGSSQSQPLMPPYHASSQDPGNVQGQRETHAVASQRQCDEMERKFQQEGRRLKLVERRWVGGNLPYLCIFEGKDAQPGYYDDNRLKN